MVLIQLLLPASGAAGSDSLAPLAETRRKLADRFSGLTAYLRSPAKGWWTAPDGHTEQDDVVMVEVVTETFDRHGGGRMRPRWSRALSKSAFTFELCVDMLDEGHQ